MSTPQTPQLPPVGPVIRALREGVGLSSAALAKAAGATRSHLHRVENGEREPSPDLLYRIARIVATRMSDADRAAS